MFFRTTSSRPSTTGAATHLALPLLIRLLLLQLSFEFLQLLLECGQVLGLRSLQLSLFCRTRELRGSSLQARQTGCEGDAFVTVSSVTSVVEDDDRTALTGCWKKPLKRDWPEVLVRDSISFSSCASYSWLVFLGASAVLASTIIGLNTCARLHLYEPLAASCL